MSNILLNQLADDFAKLLLAGKVEEAADKYWATDVCILKPAPAKGDEPIQITGFVAARETLSIWLSHNKMEDISIDGPFITGNQFALFIDMQIVDLVSGKRRDFAEIATFIILDNKIIEERFFY